MNSPKTSIVLPGAPLLLWVLLLLLPATVARAQPELVNYQGRLTDATGVAVSGNLALEFNIWDQPIGGARLWGPFRIAGVRVLEGRFNVILGPKDTGDRRLLETFPAGSERFLEIKVGDDDPIAPRQQFLSVPYAFFAHNLTDVLEKERLEIRSPNAVARFELSSEKANEGSRDLIFARRPTERVGGGGSLTDGMKLAYDAVADHLGVYSLTPGGDDPGTIPDEGLTTLTAGPHLTIARDGKIGIGTAQPRRALDVKGDVDVTGELKADGGLRLAALKLSELYRAAKGAHFSPPGELIPGQVTMTSTDTSFCFLTDVSVQGLDADGEIARCNIGTADGKWVLTAAAIPVDAWAYCEARCFEYRR